METLFCMSCKARSFDEGKRILYLCRIKTLTGFEYEDWYSKPKDVGHYTIHVNVKKYDLDGKKKFLPVARLGEYVGLVIDASEGQDVTNIPAE